MVNQVPGPKHYFNPIRATGLAVTYRSEPVFPELGRLIAGEFPFREVMKTYLDRFVLPEYRSKLLLLTDLSAMREHVETVVLMSRKDK